MLEYFDAFIVGLTATPSKQTLGFFNQNAASRLATRRPAFGRCYSPKTGRAYIGTTPSKKRVQRICQAISVATRRSQTQQAAEQLVAQLNRQIIGWANYFCLGPVSRAYRVVEEHTRGRLRHWLRTKHKRKGAGRKPYSDQVLHDTFGLTRLTQRTASFPCATS